MPLSPAETRYARSGDHHLAYQVIGDGPIDVVVAAGWVSNVEWMWESQFWVDIFERFSSSARLIVWDKRGTGLSDPVERVPTLGDQADDLDAVMAAAGSERAAIFGYSEGGSMALLFAATRPDKVSALALYGSSPRLSRAPDWEFGWTPQLFGVLLDDAMNHWGSGALLEWFGPSVADDRLAREQFGRFQRVSASPGMARAVLQAANDVDCREILGSVRVPTLVLHCGGDRLVPVGAGRYLAEHIEGARLVELPGDDHQLAIGGKVARLVDELEGFLTGSLPIHDDDRVLATVLFTDIVDSTRRASDLGDAAWRSVLDRHDHAVRRQLERFRGREIKTLGDGFMVTFDSPARAIRCACAITDVVRGLGVEVRAGLHTGELQLRGDDIAGVAVHIAARVAAKAAAGQVLVSGAVPPLVAGSGLRFEDLGSHELKGIAGEWTLFAVDRR